MTRPTQEKDCPDCGHPMRWKNLEKDICEHCNPPVLSDMFTAYERKLIDDRESLVRQSEELAKAIHYPDCWDTAVYPDLQSALLEICRGCGCSVCKPEGGEAVAEVLSVDPMKCTAVVKWQPELNGHVPEAIWNIGAKLYTRPDDWTWCSEWMPEVDEEVNVWLDYARRQTATMRFVGYDELGNHIWCWHNSDDRTTLTPKAWRPLPQPPIQEPTSDPRYPELPPVNWEGWYTKKPVNESSKWFWCTVVAHDQGKAVIRTKTDHYHARGTDGFEFSEEPVGVPYFIDPDKEKAARQVEVDQGLRPSLAEQERKLMEQLVEGTRVPRNLLK